MPFSTRLVEAAKEVLARAKAGKLGIVTAESCTSGLLASVLSEAPGAAELFTESFVTYTKRNRPSRSGCRGAAENEGRGLRRVARAMAEGALERSPADVSVAITGVAGPSPDEDGNPVGLVCIAVARRGFRPAICRRTTATSPVMRCGKRDAGCARSPGPRRDLAAHERVGGLD
jgi:nicotinamide-nucleotide amidase